LGSTLHLSIFNFLRKLKLHLYIELGVKRQQDGKHNIARISCVNNANAGTFVSACAVVYGRERERKEERGEREP
jgi:hypothetical protein